MSTTRLSRRQVLKIGAAGVLYCALPRIAAHAACVVRPEQTEGPYFVAEELNRSDIRIDPSTGKSKPGTPLILRFVVWRMPRNGGPCAPLSGAYVDVWHCDAQGVYSDVTDPSFNTKGQKFLRGYQRTNHYGVAAFTTIYPGWYEGRAVHIHFKIRSAPQSNTGHEFISQLYFPDSLTDRVQTAASYQKSGTRTRNEDDGIFRSGGKDLILRPEPAARGYAASFAIGLLMA